jgi:hypothetical protein
MNTPESLEQLQGTTALSLELASEQAAGLFLLLQNDFFIEASVGCTIENFFIRQLGLSADFVQARIQGIFLDGKPADDIETAIIRDGARLTLSGTMPGLAGIALRRGPLAVFRLGITHQETGDYCHAGQGIIQLKLLNLLMKDLGPDFLKQGIYINSSELAGYLGNLPTGFWQECKTILLDGEKVSAELFQDGLWLPESKLVKFSVVPC